MRVAKYKMFMGSINLLKQFIYILFHLVVADARSTNFVCKRAT